MTRQETRDALRVAIAQQHGITTAGLSIQQMTEIVLERGLAGFVDVPDSPGAARTPAREGDST